jgi:hypothetical protein
MADGTAPAPVSSATVQSDSIFKLNSTAKENLATEDASLAVLGGMLRPKYTSIKLNSRVDAPNSAEEPTTQIRSDEKPIEVSQQDAPATEGMK